MEVNMNIPKSSLRRIEKSIQNNMNPILKRLSTRVDKRTVRNIKKTSIGIINARSTRISEIAFKSKKTCKRLISDAKRTYRLLDSPTWDKDDLEQERLISTKLLIDNDTPIAIDHSHIPHRSSKKIEGVCLMRASDKGFIPAHAWIQAVAKLKNRRIVPLNNLVFSYMSKNFKSINNTTIEFLDNLYRHIDGKGIWLLDRGFGSKHIINKLLDLKVKFIVRLQKNRAVFINGEKHILKSLLPESTYPYKLKIKMKRKSQLLSFNYAKVRLTDIKEEMWIVYTKSISQESYIILTNCPIKDESDALEAIKTYRHRWSVEDFFRSMKQELGIEKMMVRTLKRVNKLIEIAMLAYLIAFMLLIEEKLISHTVIEAGGRLGIKSKDEDTIGRIMKGLNIIMPLLL